MCILVEGCVRGVEVCCADGVGASCADGAGVGCVSVKNAIRFEPFLGRFYAGRMHTGK